MRIPTAFAALFCAALLASCGGDDSDATAGSTSTPTAGDDAAQLAAIKDYLLAAHRAPEGRDGDDPRGRRGLLRAGRGGRLRLRQAAPAGPRGREVASSRARRRPSSAANPAYEEMEGVVAGVPELADFDVIIDAGADGSDPENAVPFDDQDAGRPHVQAARQLQLPDRDRRLRDRSEVRRQGRQARSRRRRQGRVRRGGAGRELLRGRRARVREVGRRARRRGPQVAARRRRMRSPRWWS